MSLLDDIVYESEPFGSGSFGSVHRGAFRASGKRVVVKKSLPLGTEGTKGRPSPSEIYKADRFSDLEVDHPFVVPLLGIEESPSGELYVVMPEYSTHLGDLVQKLKAENQSQALLKDIRWTMFAAEIILNIGVALQELHEEYTLPHLDIKENNILVNVSETVSLAEVMRNHHVALADRGGKDLPYLVAGLQESDPRDELFTRAKRTATLKLEALPQFYSSSLPDKEQRVDIYQLARLARRLLTQYDSPAVVHQINVKNDPFIRYKERNPFLTDGMLNVIEKGAVGEIDQGDITRGHVYSSVREFVTAFIVALSESYCVGERKLIPKEAAAILRGNVCTSAGYFVRTSDMIVELYYGNRKLCREEVDTCAAIFEQAPQGRYITGVRLPKQQHPADGHYQERRAAVIKQILEAYQRNYDAELRGAQRMLNEARDAHGHSELLLGNAIGQLEQLRGETVLHALAKQLRS